LSSSNTQDRKQKLVDHFFDTNATYWRDTYKQKDILGVIYQRRQVTALKFIDSLSLSRASHILEIGSGAGLMTLSLARRGFFVEAIDHSQAMVDLTLKSAKEEGLGNKINAHTGDVHNLTFEDDSFDLVVALGVIPWLHDSDKALDQIRRVTRPDGYAVLTMDNASRATVLLDPLTFPAIAQVRRIMRRRLERAGLLTVIDWGNAPPYRLYSPKEFRGKLRRAGLSILKSTSVGFGPFTFFGHRLFPEWVGIKIDQKLQSYADNKMRFLKSTGSQYIVLARKK
jgi:ubiquinone/menaquinone biosynthesis C-methylase UbiE